MLKSGGCDMVTDVVVTHPSESVIVIVYIPAASPVAEEEVLTPDDQE
jgi:hypothetical protein